MSDTGKPFSQDRLVPGDPHNWSDDFTHGNYECSCAQCGSRFIGHKRRVICKLCVTNPVFGSAPGAPLPQGTADELLRKVREAYQGVGDLEGTGENMVPLIAEIDAYFKRLGGGHSPQPDYRSLLHAVLCDWMTWMPHDKLDLPSCLAARAALREGSSQS